MAQAMRPVIDFCNKVKDEKKEREDLRRVGPGPLERAIDEARPKPIEKIRPSAFAYPKPGRRGTRPDEVNVLFKYPTADAERVKKAIKARSYSDAGKKTFDYYFKNVVRDE